MEHDTPSYLRDRAKTELELAEKAAHPVAMQAHKHLASLYLNRLEQIERREPGGVSARQ